MGSLKFGLKEIIIKRGKRDVLMKNLKWLATCLVVLCLVVAGCGTATTSKHQGKAHQVSLLKLPAPMVRHFPEATWL